MLVDESANQVVADTQRPDGVLLEKGEGTGVERGLQNKATIIGDMTVAVEEVVACRVGQENSCEPTSTRSRPSDLFDSLDLSVS